MEPIVVSAGRQQHNHHLSYLIEAHVFSGISFSVSIQTNTKRELFVWVSGGLSGDRVKPDWIYYLLPCTESSIQRKLSLQPKASPFIRTGVKTLLAALIALIRNNTVDNSHKDYEYTQKLLFVLQRRDMRPFKLDDDKTGWRSLGGWSFSYWFGQKWNLCYRDPCG